MTQHFASALPRKRFFLEMFTRDIALDECILDLIDNSIDGLLRSHHPKLSTHSLMQRPVLTGRRLGGLPVIEITFDHRTFVMTDTCGGIALRDAEDDIFNFGYSHDRPAQTGRLGVYGVGLKRALFKIGRHVRMSSRTTQSGFELDLDVEAWAARDASLDDWRFPIQPLPGTKDGGGTRIEVSDLRPEVAMRFKESAFGRKMADQVARTYLLFLNRLVRVRLNGVWVEPFANPLGVSKEISLASDSFEEDGVSIRLFAGLAARDGKEEWNAETAGWYVFCRGRAVAVADKSGMTGWGPGGVLPQFQPKFRGFVGLAFFDADDPLKLPWTTTKRGLNQESSVFQASLSRMRGLARPVISFLDRRYRGEPEESTELRSIATNIAALGTDKLAATTAAQPFRWTAPIKEPKTTVRVQFDAEMAEINLVRRHLRRAKLTAGQVGAHCLAYFLKAEGLR